MKQENRTRFRKALLPVTATAVAVGAFLGLPLMKALAAAQDLKVAPMRNVPRPVPQLNIIQPSQVNPTARKLVGIAHEALSDDALAERIFSDPDAVAAQYGLSDQEKRVLSHMDREQFATARADAEALRTNRLDEAAGRQLPASAIDTGRIAEQMVVGRAILAAVGRSYLDAADAHACCPWSKSIELGVSPARSFYDRVFASPARLNAVQTINQVPRSN